MEIKPIVKDDFLVLEDEATLSELIGKMKNFEKRTALVFRKKKYMGLIEKKKLLKSRLDAKEIKIKKFTKKTAIVNENADIIETAYQMFQSNLEYIPVEKDKTIIGVLNSVDLAAVALKLPELKRVKVTDIRLNKPGKLNKKDAVSCAMNVMYKDKVDQVPIFDKGKVFGIITFRDILRKYINWTPKRDSSAKFNIFAKSRCASSNSPKIDSLPVADFSTNYNLVTVKPHESLKNAVKLMAEKRISDLLVMDEGNYLGLLTLKNVLRKIGSLKIPQNFNIKFVGLTKTKLVPHQRYNLRKIASNEAFKLQRKIKNEMNFVIHIKEYEKDGTQRKYSINLRIESPGRIITVNQDDWDFETALRKTFNNAKNKVRKMYRGDSSWDKAYE
jgi:CBS domain-containing protein